MNKKREPEKDIIDILISGIGIAALIVTLLLLFAIVYMFSGIPIGKP